MVTQLLPRHQVLTWNIISGKDANGFALEAFQHVEVVACEFGKDAGSRQLLFLLLALRYHTILAVVVVVVAGRSAFTRHCARERRERERETICLSCVCFRIKITKFPIKTVQI